MRNPRLSALIAVAHGSRDPHAAATVGELVALVRARAGARGLAGLDVRAAFLDHCAPSLPQVLGAVDDACVVVPLLLTAAYHSKTDIPAQIASAHPALDVRCADPLGPHPLLLAALERRLLEAGLRDDGGAAAGGDTGDDARARSTTSVVLVAAGSGDHTANATIAALAAQWRRDGGWRDVVPAYASAAGPSPGEAVRELRSRVPGTRVAVATYLLAPGYFADKIRREAFAAGADIVSGALGAAPEVADLVVDRYESSRAAAGVVAKAQLS